MIDQRKRTIASKPDVHTFLLLLAAALILIAFLGGCSASQIYQPVPAGLDRSRVPVDTVRMTAEHFKFTPDEIHVKAGTLVHVEIKSISGTHGFAIGEFGIDEELEEGVQKTVEFYVPVKGEYGFKCSHLCGMGHLGMNGKLIVE